MSAYRRKMLLVSSAALVAAPGVWMVRLQPVPLAGPMFSAALMALVLCLLCAGTCTARTCAPRLGGLNLALGAIVFAILVQWAAGHFAFSASPLQALAALLLAGMLAKGVAGLRPNERRSCADGAAWGFVVAGVWNTGVAMLQFVELDGLVDCCAMVDVSGSVTGNLQQSNHLSSYLAWAVAAALYLCAIAQLSRGATIRITIFLAFGIGLTGQRIGLVELAAIVVGLASFRWRAVRVAQGSRMRLSIDRLLLPAALAFATAVMTAQLRPLLGAPLGLVQMGVGERVSAGGSLRAQMWQQTLALIPSSPWSGVGWDQLGYALLVAPGIPVPYEAIHNAHNLPLHLAVVLGLPAAALAVGGLVWALVAPVVRAFRRPRSVRPEGLLAALGLLTISLHSLVEYPLWYHHLLVPTALFFGLLSGAASAPRPGTDIRIRPARRPRLRVAYAFGILGFAVWLHAANDYRLVHAAYSIERGTSMEPVMRAEADCVWFAPQAAFAAVMTMPRRLDNEEEIHRRADRIMRVSVNPNLLVSEASWFQREGMLVQAQRYAAYLGSVFGYSLDDAGKPLDAAAVALKRPALHALADEARKGAANFNRFLGRPTRVERGLE